jgi:archaemetzincin
MSRTKKIAVITGFCILSVTLAMEFKQPTKTERLKAIGSTDELEDVLKKALEPGDYFEPIAAPRSGDWLAEHKEYGQTFDEFVKSKPNRPGKVRNKIYLQPLGQFPKGQISLLDKLDDYAAAYFCMEVKTLEPLDIRQSNLTIRRNPYTGNQQILTSDILNLLKKNVPADAFCVLAITMEDLYPEPSWNFVFGQASLRERVGVYSFARYDPAFYGQKRNKDYEKILLRRSCRVLAHETGHMFGLHHCIYFRCVLNGSNHLQESDSRPLQLCPVCLRKLQYSIGFDVVNRYSKLFHFYKNNGLKDEAQWLKRRLEYILGPEKAKEALEQKTPQ